MAVKYCVGEWLQNEIKISNGRFFPCAEEEELLLA